MPVLFIFLKFTGVSGVLASVLAMRGQIACLSVCLFFSKERFIPEIRIFGCWAVTCCVLSASFSFSPSSFSSSLLLVVSADVPSDVDK